MLEIKPIQHKQRQKEICELCGIDFDPEALAYSAQENEKILGISQFRILGKQAVIFALEGAKGVEDKGALVMAGKATLNFLDLCGVEEVVAKVKNKELLSELGFEKSEKSSNGEYRLDLAGYFDSLCHGNVGALL